MRPFWKQNRRCAEQKLKVLSHNCNNDNFTHYSFTVVSHHITKRNIKNLVRNRIYDRVCECEWVRACGRKDMTPSMPVTGNLNCKAITIKLWEYCSYTPTPPPHEKHTLKTKPMIHFFCSSLPARHFISSKAAAMNVNAPDHIFNNQTANCKLISTFLDRHWWWRLQCHHQCLTS
jgi:hypothetical protein